MTITDFIDIALREGDHRVASAARRLHDWRMTAPEFSVTDKYDVLWLFARIQGDRIKLFRLFANGGMYINLGELREADRLALRLQLERLDPTFSKAVEQPTFDVRTIADENSWSQFSATIERLAAGTLTVA